MRKLLFFAAGLTMLCGCTKSADVSESRNASSAARSANRVVTYTITEHISFSQGWKVEHVNKPTGQTGVPPGMGDTITVIESTGWTASVQHDCSPWPSYGELYIPYSNGQQAVILNDYQQWNFPNASFEIKPIYSRMWINASDPAGEVSEFRINYMRYDQFGRLADTYSGVLPTRQITTGTPLPENPVSVVWSYSQRQWLLRTAFPVRSDVTVSVNGTQLVCLIPAGCNGTLTGNSNPTLFTVSPGMAFSPLKDAYYAYTKGDFNSGPGSAVVDEIRITLTRSGDEWIIEANQFPDQDVIVTCDGWDVLDATYVIPKGQTSVRTGPADAGLTITNVVSFGSKYKYVW